MRLSHMLLLVVSWIMIQMGNIDAKCFPALFTFGDSNTDTGEDHTAFPDHVQEPYGSTFFKKPAGRASDGRLIIDFIAQASGLPFLTPYLKQVGPFKQGVNFASNGAAILPRNNSLKSQFPFSVFDLTVQLQQMREFKSIVEQVHNKDESKRFPSPNVFGKSLFILYIGQADVVAHVDTLGAEGVKQFFPKMISNISHTIRELYELGGRTFWVYGMGPAGCDPTTRKLVNHDQSRSHLDSAGCYFPLNDAVLEYNKMLRESLSEIRGHYLKASITYVDIFRVKLDLYKNPVMYGLKYGDKVCRGQGEGNYDVSAQCGSPSAPACKDPWNYVSWDGAHLTEHYSRIESKQRANSVASTMNASPHKRSDGITSLRRRRQVKVGSTSWRRTLTQMSSLK